MTIGCTTSIIVLVMLMNVIEYYVQLVNKYLENPSNSLHKKRLKKYNNKYEALARKYDKTLLKQYQYIEKLLDEELKDKNK